jgi:hypothetical protein
MSILYKHAGLPVFSEIKYAKSWGEKYNLLDFHTHEKNGRIGYMAGPTHADLVKIIKAFSVSGIHEQSSLDNWAGGVPVNTSTTITNPSVAPPVTPTIATPSGGGGGYSGGGGGGGY